MLQFLADHNFNEIILRGTIRRGSLFDVIRTRDIGLDRASDPALLEWAANNRRVILTHDVRTMAGFAYQRVKDGLRMLGVVEVGTLAPFAVLIEDILIVASCDESELVNRVIYIPLH